MRKIILLPLVFSLLCGCSSKTVKIDIKEKIYEENGCVARIEYPLISHSSDFAKEINTEYSVLCDSMLNSFLSAAERSDLDGDTLQVKQKTTFCKNNIVSLVGECEALTDGTRLSRIVYNLDFESGKKIKLSDLFSDGEYIKRINSYIQTEYKRHPEKFLDLWKQPTMTENREFYITDKGIVIFFAPYELSYYSKGYVDVQIPFDELHGYINPDYWERLS